MGNKSLKKKYEKYIKADAKANTLEYEFIKEFRKTVPYDKLLSLKEVIEKKGTEEDKIKYFRCCENYNKGQITSEEYEIYVYYKEIYGGCTKENKIKERILGKRD